MNAPIKQSTGPQGKFPWEFVALIGSIGIGTLLMLLMLLELI